MEAGLIEQLVSIVLAVLSFIIAIFGPTFYFLSKFTETKFSEVSLKVNAYIRNALSGFIEDAYILSMNAASLLQLFLDFIYFILDLGATKAEQKVAQQTQEVTEEGLKASIKKFFTKLANVFNKIDEKLSKISRGLGGILIEVPFHGVVGTGVRIALKRTIKSWSKKFAMRAVEKIIYGVVFYVLYKFSFNLGRTAYKAFYGHPTYMFMAMLLTGFFFGGFPIIFTEYLFRATVSLIDILYSPVVESRKFDRREDMINYIASRVKFCWETFGKGEWTVNYLRGNPAYCYIGFFDYKGDPINLSEVVNKLRDMEKEDKKFFEKGRFVILLKEGDLNGKNLNLVYSKVCYEGFSNCPSPDTEISEAVNITVYLNHTSGKKEKLASEKHNLFVLAITFAECVPWDYYTFDVSDKLYALENDKLGEMGIAGQIVSFFTSEATAYYFKMVKCTQPDTLYINFIKPEKNSYVEVVLEKR